MFSTVDEAGETAQVAGFRPANCALRALILCGSQSVAGVHQTQWLVGSAAAMATCPKGS